MYVYIGITPLISDTENLLSGTVRASGNLICTFWCIYNMNFALKIKWNVVNKYQNMVFETNQ